MGEERAGRGWPARGAAYAGLLAVPLVCMAHVCGVILIFRQDSVLSLLSIALLVSVMVLAVAVAALWGVVDRGSEHHDAVVGLGFLAMMLAYPVAYLGAGDWMLRWQGIETTCTVLDVEKRWEKPAIPAPNYSPTAEPRDSYVLRYHHELACADPAAPATMTTDTDAKRGAGDRIAVVYDPSAGWGAWGIAPAAELVPGGNLMGASGAVVAGGTGVWTLCVLGCAAADLRAHLRFRRRPDGA